jgi:hypothetical protein
MGILARSKAVGGGRLTYVRRGLAILEATDQQQKRAATAENPAARLSYGNAFPNGALASIACAGEA